MKLVLFSSSDRSLSEAKEVTQMFEEGLEIFHLKKSNFNKTELEAYLGVIPSKFHNRIVLHSYHQLRKKFKVKGIHISRTHRKKKYKGWWKQLKLKLSTRRLATTRTFSKLSSLSEDNNRYDYVFLSPIYDSISKNGHSGNFGTRSISKYVAMSKSPVYALGGVDPIRFSECKELGFEGVAVLGYVWNHESLSPIEAYREAQRIAESV